MKLIPILFKPEMVAAILDGRKTMTRRVIKFPKGWVAEDNAWDWVALSEFYPKWGCPYGQPGDVLWVRETWGIGTRPDPIHGWIDGFEFKADEAFADNIEPLPIYPNNDFDFEKHKPGKWKPSLFMPKDACRLFLEITNIRVERLQDISEQDAIAEGIESDFGAYRDYLAKGKYKFYSYDSAIDSFQSLWESINGKESWDDNPWLWIVEFKQTEKPTNFIS